MEIASITIGGEDWTARVQAVSLTRETGGASSTCTLTVEDDLAAKARVGYAIVGTATVADRLAPQREVIVTADGGAVLFRGRSSRLSVVRNNSRSNSYALQCRDYTHLLESAVIVSELFTSRTDAEMLAYLFATYLPAIDTSEVAGFATIHSLELSDESLMSAMRKIQDRTGAEWFVDPYLKLQYYDPATRPAAFGFSQHPDGVSTFEFLRDGFDYAEDFTTPANRVTVVGTKLVATSAFESFAVPANADDGNVGRTGVTYPPGGTISASTAAPTVSNSYSGGYSLQVALVRFDTSGIPDDATVVSAALRFHVAPIYNANNASLGVEYFASSNWPIDSADYTATPSNSAHGYTLVSSYIAGGMVECILTDAAANINKTGYTGFRIHLKVTGTPTGNNVMFLRGRETADGLPPSLEVAYSTPTAAGMSQTYDDAESQAEYGVFEKVIVDETVKSEPEALARAQIEAERYAWPIRAGVVSWERDGIGVGEYLPLEIHAFGVFGEFTVKRLRMAWTRNRTRYTADFGEHRPDLVRYLSRIRG